MAQKKKATATTKKETEATKVTRITAKDDAPAKAKKPATKAATTKKVTSKDTPAKEIKESKPSDKKERKNFFAALGGYFKGAWYELRQVRWPNRRTTWGLTLAVIAFTVFFVTLILLLDLGFQWLFDQILG